MNKKVLSIFFVAFILISIVLVCLMGCELSLEDVVPQELGEIEGLWLYNGNSRMRTDGSGSESIINEVSLGEKTFNAGEYTIDKIVYNTEKKYIYAILEADGTDYLYLVDYANKTQQAIYSFDCANCSLSVSEHYLYAKCDKNDHQDDWSVLFSCDGSLVEKNLTGTLNNDIVEYFSLREYCWWKNGTLRTVTVPDGSTEHNSVVCGNYRYFFDYNLPIIYALNLNEGTITNIMVNGMPKFPYSLVVGDTVYFIASDVTVDNTPAYFGIYELKGCDLRLLRTLSQNEPIAITRFIKADNEHICIQTESAKETKYYQPLYYNVKNGQFTTNFKKDDRQNIVTCGEYTFYVDKLKYGAFMGNSFCHYLKREKDGKTEIMQYSLDNDGNFYQDIYEK